MIPLSKLSEISVNTANASYGKKYQGWKIPSIIIALEGADGTGKSTLRQKLELEISNWIKRNIQPSLFHRNPMLDKLRVQLLTQPTYRYRQQIMETPVDDWVRMLYLFFRDRNEQYLEEIKPAGLEGGTIFLMDRYYHSTCVYQGKIHGLADTEQLLKAQKEFILQPELTLVLHIPEFETRLERICHKKGFVDGKSFDEHSGVQDKIAEHYLDLIQEPHFSECVLLDTSGTHNQVLQSAWEHIEPLLVQTYSPIMTTTTESGTDNP